MEVLGNAKLVFFINVYFYCQKELVSGVDVLWLHDSLKANSIKTKMNWTQLEIALQ